MRARPRWCGSWRPWNVPTRGTPTIAGHDLLTDPMGVKHSISLTGQFAAVDDVLTDRENLEMMAQLRRLPKRAVRDRAMSYWKTSTSPMRLIGVRARTQEGCVAGSTWR